MAVYPNNIASITIDAATQSDVTIQGELIGAGALGGAGQESFDTAAGITINRGYLYTPTFRIHDYSALAGCVAIMEAHDLADIDVTFLDTGTGSFNLCRFGLEVEFADDITSISIAGSDGTYSSGVPDANWTSLGTPLGKVPIVVRAMMQQDGYGRPYWAGQWMFEVEFSFPSTVLSTITGEGDHTVDTNKLAIEYPDSATNGWLGLDNVWLNTLVDPGQAGPDGLRMVRLRATGVATSFANLVEEEPAADYFNAFTLSANTFGYTQAQGYSDSGAGA